jgi:hypothetical protein
VLVESLVSVRWPGAEVIELPTPWAAGVRNLLLEGTWSERREITALSPGAALARLHRALKALDPDGHVVFSAGAIEPFEALATEAPFPDEDAIPDGWQRGLCDGTIRFDGRTARVRYIVRGRLSDRVAVGEPALSLVLRGVWAELTPEGDDPTFEQDVVASLAEPLAIARMRAWLLLEAEAVVAALRAAFDPSAEFDVRSRVLLIEDGAGLDDVLAGLPAGTLRALLAVGAAFKQLRPRVGLVYVRRAEARVRAWRGAPWLEEDPADDG